MAETLGSLCDKLTIAKLKQWHSSAPDRLESLALQEKQLAEEIDQFVSDAVAGRTPIERLTFAANKVYRQEGNPVPKVEGGIGEVFSRLVDINCKLWHQVDKGYEIEKVPIEEKDGIIKQLALLNLERNQCIDTIDRQFRSLIEQRQINTKAT